VNGCGHRPRRGGARRLGHAGRAGRPASATSSWSTKLIHGGLRYLEHYEFRLVREALIEREVLWAIAPHIIRPLRFVLPHHEGLRPPGCCASACSSTTISAAASASARRAPSTSRRDAAGAPLKAGYGKAFEYSDCRVDDSRLVVLNARDAADRGAIIRTRSARGRRAAQGRALARHLEDRLRRRHETVTARALVNAAGPWVESFLTGAAQTTPAGRVRLVQGSHIVVRRLFDHDRCLHLPERRQPHHLRHPLRGRLHPDRHDRPGLCRRPRRGGRASRRSPISARRQRVLPRPVTPRRRGVDLFRRAPALRRRRLRRPGGDARLRPSDKDGPGRNVRRCSRSSAARSPPTAGSPRRRWRS
jgi:hypothetical protein